MLAQETLLQLQKYNFDLLARQEPSGRRRLRYIALAHIKDGKSSTETALALRVTPRAVTQWLKWFIEEGVDRLDGIPHYWSTQRLPKAQEKAFRQAVEELQRSRGGGRARGEDIRKRSISRTSLLSIALHEPPRIATTLYSDRRCPGMSGWQRRGKCRRNQIMRPAVCSPVVAGRSETAAGP